MKANLQLKWDICHILTSEYIDDLEFYPLFYLCTYKKIC